VRRSRNSSPEELPSFAFLDREAAAATVTGARLLCGIDPSLAVDLELDLQESIEVTPPWGRETVLAYAIEHENEPFVAVDRLSLEALPDRSLIRLQSFRHLPDGWAPMGNVALEIEAARALFSEVLQLAPDRPGEGRVQ
jgi:hypothetical protein